MGNHEDYDVAGVFQVPQESAYSLEVDDDGNVLGTVLIVGHDTLRAQGMLCGEFHGQDVERLWDRWSKSEREGGTLPGAS